MVCELVCKVSLVLHQTRVNFGLDAVSLIVLRDLFPSLNLRVTGVAPWRLGVGSVDLGLETLEVGVLHLFLDLLASRIEVVVDLLSFIN